MQYIAKIMIEKKMFTTNICILLLNISGYIVGMTSNSVQMLHLSNNTLEQYNVDMKDVAPELFFSKIFYTKNGYGLNLHIPVDIPNISNLNVAPDIEDKKNLPKGALPIELHCWLTELKYEGIGSIGHVVKLEKRSEEVQAKPLKKYLKIPSFRFRYDEMYNKIFRELEGGESSYNNIFLSHNSTYNFSQLAEAKKKASVLDYKTNSSNSGQQSFYITQLSNNQFRKMTSSINIPSRSVSRTTTKTVGRSEFDKSA